MLLISMPIINASIFIESSSNLIISQEHPSYDENRCHVFHCDVTEDALTDHVPPGSVSIATLIFVLSAIHPDKMVQVLSNIYQVCANRSDEL